MTNQPTKCRVCGGRILPPARAEFRDYCKREFCIKEAGRVVRVVAVPTHKSIPMILAEYVPGEHLDNRRNR